MIKPPKPQDRFEALAQMGCIVCRLFHGVRSEANIHHLTGLKYRGIGMKAKDEFTIPLCPTHHQYGSKEYPSVHGYPKLFREKYGTQEELLAIVNETPIGLG